MYSVSLKTVSIKDSLYIWCESGCDKGCERGAMVNPGRGATKGAKGVRWLIRDIVSADNWSFRSLSMLLFHPFCKVQIGREPL